MTGSSAPGPIFHSLVWIYLEELLTGLNRHGLEVPELVMKSIDLTSYASEARYPGLYEPVSPDEYNEAVTIAEAVVQWTESIMESA